MKPFIRRLLAVSVALVVMFLLAYIADINLDSDLPGDEYSSSFENTDNSSSGEENQDGSSGESSSDLSSSGDSSDSSSEDSSSEDSSADSKDENLLDPEGYYYDVESVVLYLHTYGELPLNYITKDDARSLGWEGGSVEAYMEDAAIGGDHFGNYEGLLPKASGRKYTECDIDTHNYKNRGSRRLIFSNDGLYFYTSDHYETFDELYVDENGEVQWK